MSKTKLSKIAIKKFRALNDVDIEFGDYITVICGKNGTSKSSILGIAAQIFSFEKDYVSGKSLSGYKQISGRGFKSKYSEHIRISEIFDVPGSLSASIFIHDGYTNVDATADLELMTRTDQLTQKIVPRPVIRNNSTAIKNKSRNFTHPVIFLSLKRLYPIADREYEAFDSDYLKANKEEFVLLTNELLNRSSTQATGTQGTITSAVAHGDNYNHESVSAGEDNAGQIIMALLSFKKLKAEYPDYKGGLLLIDEVDAGLFPTAQVNLLKIFDRECRQLNLQVIMTSHSPTIIEYAFAQSQKEYSKKFKTIYLSNTYGDVQVMQDWSWGKISTDIQTQTYSAGPTVSLPIVNVYFEDKEAEDFLAALLHRQPIKKYVNLMSGIDMGCKNYKQLIDKKVPEFAVNSVICLDADAKSDFQGKLYQTVIWLPGEFPPDQLIFQHLHNLPAEDDFWKNKLQFTREVFTNEARETINKLKVTGNQVDLVERIKLYKGNEKLRDIFKNFYKGVEVHKVLGCGVTKPYSAWRHWIAQNPQATNEFLESFTSAIYGVMKNGYSVEDAKLLALKVNLKKVSSVL